MRQLHRVPTPDLRPERRGACGAALGGGGRGRAHGGLGAIAARGGRESGRGRERRARLRLGRRRERRGRRLDRIRLEGEPAYHPGWNKWIALHSLLSVSEAVARAALERTESRGAHSRLDHPDADPELEGVNVVVRREGEGMALGHENISTTQIYTHLVDGELEAAMRGRE